jgi:hypothetical protein
LTITPQVGYKSRVMDPHAGSLIKFNCPHCGISISAEAEDTGRKAPCPSCAGDILVPHAAEPLPPASNAPPPLPQPAPSEREGLNTPPLQSRASSFSLTDFATFFQKPEIRAFLSDRRRIAMLWGIGLLGIIFLLYGATRTSPSASSASPTVSAEDQFTAQMQGYMETTRNSPCRACNGSGQIRNRLSSSALRNSPDAGSMPTCRECYGAGTITTASGYIVPCRSCGGRGMPESVPCPSCRGTGRL